MSSAPSGGVAMAGYGLVGEGEQAGDGIGVAAVGRQRPAQHPGREQGAQAGSAGADRQTLAH